MPDIRQSYAQRLGSVLGDQGAMNMAPAPHTPNEVIAYAEQTMPSIPEQIGIDRGLWATYSPGVRQAILVGKLPDLSPAGITAVILKFNLCAPDRGFVPENPGVPGGPPPVSENPGAPGGPPPMSENPGVQGGPPPTSQTVGAQPPPMMQQAFVAPGGMVYVQAYAAPGGAPIGYYQLPQTGIQPAGQAQQSGPQYPPLLGWLVLGGALLATAWMFYEITRMRSGLQHAKRT
jgi:hypothetical protein